MLTFIYVNITNHYPYADLIRVNFDCAYVSAEIEKKSISISNDIGKALSYILNYSF